MNSVTAIDRPSFLMSTQSSAAWKRGEAGSFSLRSLQALHFHLALRPSTPRSWLGPFFLRHQRADREACAWYSLLTAAKCYFGMVVAGQIFLGPIQQRNIFIGALSHPRRRQSFLFHLTAHHFHWTTSQSRGPSLATADANKNLDDVMCIPCAMDVETIWNRTSFAPFFLLLLYNPLLLLSLCSSIPILLLSPLLQPRALLL